MIKKIAALLTIITLSSCSYNPNSVSEVSSVNNSVSTLNNSKSFDSYFNDVITKNKSVGLSVAVIKGDKVEYHNYGYVSKSNKTAPTENSVFHVASISKAFTGVLLGDMVLREVYL